MAEISLELQLRTSSPPAPEPTLRARHRRFFESKRRENRSIEERGHHKHKLNKNGTFDTSDSSDDGGASKARVPRPLPPGATPTLAATTSSPVGSLGSSEAPTIVGNFNLSIYTNNFVANTYGRFWQYYSLTGETNSTPKRPPITNETPAARLADQKAAPTVPPPQVSKTPVAAPQPTPFPTSSDTPNVSGIPTNIGGLGGPGINGFTRHASSGSTISGGMVTGIVSGVVGLIIAAVLAIIFIRKRRLRHLSYPRGALPPMSQASSGKPPSVITRARQRAESILWGSQATVGTRTEAISQRQPFQRP
ncbi:hypothetical protein HYALB_00010562 [Hymenoscyphus albidus]|uniref:Uncharacterized protein n=1 Tax=Hymenoscyphus albidus TaxID=595503 RepID=A0A9N9LHJ3_9HELO|nr:hypothetical protein HYALB_00010562 [Hymenoscyphus albidus]